MVDQQAKGALRIAGIHRIDKWFVRPGRRLFLPCFRQLTLMQYVGREGDRSGFCPLVHVPVQHLHVAALYSTGGAALHYGNVVLSALRGVVRCGMVWCDAVRCGAVRCSQKAIEVM